MVNTATQFQLLDVVALKHDLSEHHLTAGQVGTLVESLAPDVYEVEFSDDDGQTYAMLPLHTSQVLKLYYAPSTVSSSSFSAMENTIHQYGSGDNIAGDKVAGNKIGNQISGANIGNVVNEVKDNAQVTSSNFTQTTGTSTAELLQLIASLRQTAAQFPVEAQEDLIIDIDDVEEEVKKPEAHRSLSRLKKRLTALLTTASLLSGSVAAANNFVDEVVELGDKVGIELPLPPSL
jgi:internalin A